MIFIKRPRSKYSLSCCAFCFLNSFLPLVMLQHDFLNSVYIIYTHTYIHVYLYVYSDTHVYTHIAITVESYVY